MRREVSLEEISDGRLYELNDMVKADCQDCAGCHDCCEGMGDSVVLDPMDVYRLCTNLGKTPQELVSTGLDSVRCHGWEYSASSLHEWEKTNAACFLNEQGRCSIHDCPSWISADFSHWDVSMKMEDSSIFCRSMNARRPSRSKIKVKKWIDTPDLRQYEKFVADWHYFLLDVQEVLYNATDAQLIKNLNLICGEPFLPEAI